MVTITSDCANIVEKRVGMERRSRNEEEEEEKKKKKESMSTNLVLDTPP